MVTISWDNMNAVEKFNALEGRKVWRKELNALKNQAKKEGHNNVVKRINKALRAFPDKNYFHIENLKPLKNMVEGMAAPRHEGLAKVGLDECGRPLKGYYFAKGGVLTKVARNKKGEYVIVNEGNKRGQVQSTTSKDNIFTYSIKLEDNTIVNLKENEFYGLKKKPKGFKFETAKKDKKVVQLNPDHQKVKPKPNVKNTEKYDILIARGSTKHNIYTYHDIEENRSIEKVRNSTGVNGLNKYTVTDKGLKEVRSLYPNSVSVDHNGANFEDNLAPKPLYKIGQHIKFQNAEIPAEILSIEPFNGNEHVYSIKWNDGKKGTVGENSKIKLVQPAQENSTDEKYQFIYEVSRDNKYRVKTFLDFETSPSIKKGSSSSVPNLNTYTVTNAGLKKLQNKYPNNAYGDKQRLTSKNLIEGVNFKELARKAAAPKKEQRKIEGLPDFSKESTYADDFDFDTLMRSRYWISFTPDKSARSELKHWKESLAATYKELKKEAESQDFSIDELNVQFNQYYNGLLKRKKDVVSARSRTASSVITGPANFPTRKAQAASSRYHDVQGEYFNYSDYKLRKIRAKIYNREGIKSGEVDTLVKLQEKLEVLERSHKLMVAGNAALRNVLKKYKDFDDQLAQYRSELLDLGLDEKSIKSVTSLPERERNWVFGRFSTQNSSANIRNLKKRIEQEKKRILRYADGSKETEVAGIKIVENVEANRLQLIFDGKPDEAVRKILKSNGMRWSPRYKAWQRQLTPNAIRAVDKYILPELRQLGMNAPMSCSAAGSKLKSNKSSQAGAVLGSSKCKTGGKVKVSKKKTSKELTTKDRYVKGQSVFNTKKGKNAVINKVVSTKNFKAKGIPHADEIAVYEITYDDGKKAIGIPHSMLEIKDSNSKKKDDTKPVKVDDKGQYGMFGHTAAVQPLEPVPALNINFTTAPKENIIETSEPSTSHKTPVQAVASKVRTGVNSKSRAKGLRHKGPSNPLFPVSGVTSEFLGKLERKAKGSIIIALDAKQGAGKTTTGWKWMNDFASAGNQCLFASLEEEPSSNLFQEKVDSYIDPENEERITTIDEFYNYADFKAAVNAADFIFIDSWQKLEQMIKHIDYDNQVRKGFNGKVFLIIFQQTTDGKTKGGSDKVYDADAVIKGYTGDTFKENYFQAQKNRYTTTELSNIAYNVAGHYCYDPTQPLHEVKPPQPVDTAPQELQTVYG